MVKKLTLITLGTLLLAVGLTVAGHILWNAVAGRQALIAELDGLAEVVGNTTLDALGRNDAAEAERILAALRGKPVVLAAGLYTPDGALLARYRSALMPDPFTFPAVGPTAPPAGKNELSLFHTVAQNGQMAGTIYLLADLRPLQTAFLHHLIWTVLLAALVLALVAIALSLLQQRVVARVAQAAELADAIAEGDLPQQINVTSSDEIGALQHAFNRMVSTAREIVRQAQGLARGDYSITIKPRSTRDQLSHSVIKMTEALRSYHEQSEKQNWLKTGLSEVSDRMRGEQELPDLMHNILASLTSYLPAEAGAIYLSETRRRLRLVACHPRPAETVPDKMLSFGEGAVGLSAFHRRTKVLRGPDLKDPSLVVAGDGTDLAEVAVVPLVRENDVIGALVVGGASAFTANQLELLNLAAQSIAIAIHTARSRAQLSELLAQTQQQQATLQQTNAELERRTRTLQEEMALARNVQLGLLPATFPRKDRIEFGQHYLICSTLGGDIFDAFSVGPDHVGLYVADVSGHGVSAALIAGLLKMGFESLKARSGNGAADNELLQPARVLANLNDMLFQKLPRNSFITLIYGVIDLSTNDVTLANAGHPRPIRYEARLGRSEMCGLPHGPALGVLDHAEYPTVHLRLERWDKLLFYTDGITEAMNEGEEFGEARLLRAVSQLGYKDPPEMIDEILKVIDGHRAGAPVNDDCSLLVAQLR